MKVMCSIFISIFLLPGVPHATGQQPDLVQIKGVFDKVKANKEVSYSYAMAIEYPNGEKEKLDGTVCLLNRDKIMVNANNLQTIIYSPKYMYRADHVEKEVTIVNIEKHLNKDNKRQLEKELFENQAVNFYLDSMVLKYASIKKFKNKNDTIAADLVFPSGTAVQYINLIYNSKTALLISYSMKMFQPYEDRSYGKNKGTTHIISCRNFRRDKEAMASYSPDDFFTVDKGKLQLKKYSNYKLNQQL